MYFVSFCFPILQYSWNSCKKRKYPLSFSSLICNTCWTCGFSGPSDDLPPSWTWLLANLLVGKLRKIWTLKSFTDSSIHSYNALKDNLLYSWPSIGWKGCCSIVHDRSQVIWKPNVSLVPGFKSFVATFSSRFIKSSGFLKFYLANWSSLPISMFSHKILTCLSRSLLSWG